MRSSDFQENDREERLSGWEKEDASDDLLSLEARRKLYDYIVPKEKVEDKGDRENE